MKLSFCFLLLVGLKFKEFHCKSISKLIAMTSLRENSIFIEAFGEAIAVIKNQETASNFIFLKLSTLHDEILEKVLNNFTENSVQLVPSIISIDVKSIIVICVGNESEIKKLLKESENSSLNNGNFLILMLDNKPGISTLSDIFKEFSSNGVIDINIFTSIGDEIVMVSFYPFGYTKCRSSNPVIVNIYNRTMKRWKDEKVFPNKLRNCYKCPLRISTLEYPPAVMKRTSNGVEEFYGCDIEVIQGLASTMNFQVNLA